MSETQFLHGVETIEVPSATQPIQINKSGVIGAVVTCPDMDTSVFDYDTPYLLNSQPRKALSLGLTGTAYPTIRQIYGEGGAAVIIVPVQSDPDPDKQLALAIGDPVAKTGAYALLGARAELGVPPRTLIAPGIANRRVSGQANPLGLVFQDMARKLRGRVYLDTPSTSYDDALAFRDDWGSDRVNCFYPSVMVFDTTLAQYVPAPASASMAGLTARVHKELGFWYSPSNQVLQGIGGVGTPIDFASGDPDCEANILNENRITTVINIAQQTGIDYGGFRRWGNRNTADDANWMFEAVRTSLDMCYEALDEATLWAADKPPSLQLLEDVTARANAFFKYGKKVGFLIGGRCWLDPELNTPSQLKQGIWTWTIDPEAPVPMEHIIYMAQRNDQYFADEVTALAAMASTTITTA